MYIYPSVIAIWFKVLLTKEADITILHSQLGSFVLYIINALFLYIVNV